MCTFYNMAKHTCLANIVLFYWYNIMITSFGMKLMLGYTCEWSLALNKNEKNEWLI